MLSKLFSQIHMSFRFMRMILFFDLPSVTKIDLKEYRHFIKLLISKGFVMYQESVYTKLCLNQNIVDQTRKELSVKLPKDGIISILVITEQQFASIENLLGKNNSDVINDSNKVVKL